jgi:hypothetical protein
MTMIENIRNLACGVILALAMGLGGCITTPDGTTTPDYAMIEFGAVAAFTVIVNEAKVSDEAVVKAYEGLSTMEATLQKVVDGSGSLDLPIIDQMLGEAVPIEYKALATQGSKLIRSRVRNFMDTKHPDNPITESEVTLSTSLAVVKGAKAVLEPKYLVIVK